MIASYDTIKDAYLQLPGKSSFFTPPRYACWMTLLCVIVGTVCKPPTCFLIRKLVFLY